MGVQVPPSTPFCERKGPAQSDLHGGLIGFERLFVRDLSAVDRCICVKRVPRLDNRCIATGGDSLIAAGSANISIRPAEYLILARDLYDDQQL